MSWQLPASSLRGGDGGGFYANLQSGKRKPATTFSHFLCSPIHSPQTHARANKYTHTHTQTHTYWLSLVAAGAAGTVTFLQKAISWHCF